LAAARTCGAASAFAAVSIKRVTVRLCTARAMAAWYESRGAGASHVRATSASRICLKSGFAAFCA
jgi:hypothetical protein